MTAGPLAGLRAVTFDVGGTLLTPWPSVGHVYAETAQLVLGERFDPALLNERFIAAWRAAHQLPGGFNYSPADWAGVVRDTFAGLTPRAEAPELFRALWYRFSEPEVWHVFADVRPCLAELSGRGIRLAVLSNWDERLRPLLVRLDLARYFERTVVSAEVGTHKPAAAIFAHTARALGLPPEALLHVGDGQREDVAGASAAGWGALWLRRDGTGDDDSIQSLAEVSTRLRIH